MTDEPDPRPKRVIMLALVLMPALLLLSTGIAVWLHWRSETKVDPHPGLALAASEVDDDELRDLLKKLTQYIGPREWKTPAGRANMRRAIALIEGTLSPRNYGYVVETDGELTLAGERWPAVWVDAKGSGQGMVLVAAPYDTENQSIAALMVLAAELREAGLAKTLRFLFYPSELWREPGQSGLSQMGGGGLDLALCVNRFGAGPGRDLWLVGPELHEDERAIRAIVDYHEQDPQLYLNGRQFAGRAERVYEIRGTPGFRPSGEPTEVQVMAERELDGEEFEDLRLRVRRLGEILRIAAGE